MNKLEKSAAVATIASIFGLAIIVTLGPILWPPTAIVGIAILALIPIGVWGEMVLMNSKAFNKWYENMWLSRWFDDHCNPLNFL